MEILIRQGNIFKEANINNPFTSVSIERIFFLFENNKTYLRHTISEERLTNLSKI